MPTLLGGMYIKVSWELADVLCRGSSGKSFRLRGFCRRRLTQLEWEAAVDNLKMNVQGCVPLKRYLACGP